MTQKPLYLSSSFVEEWGLFFKYPLWRLLLLWRLVFSYIKLMFFFYCIKSRGYVYKHARHPPPSPPPPKKKDLWICNEIHKNFERLGNQLGMDLQTSQTQPDPNNVRAASMNFSLKFVNEPKSFSICSRRPSLGISPPPGCMDSQKKSWFQTCKGRVVYKFNDTDPILENVKRLLSELRTLWQKTWWFYVII